MKTIEFYNNVKRHMRDYKKNILEIQENVEINKKTYYHILPPCAKKFNILSPYTEKFWTFSKANQIPIHSDFSHLNSSQALCFNFFFPLLDSEKKLSENKKLKCLLKALNIPISSDYQIDKAVFEYKQQNKSEIDFFIETTNEIKVFFEIKYTEPAFGTTTMKNQSPCKFNRILGGNFKNLIEKDIVEDGEKTKKNYQLIRNIINIGEKSYTVFIYPHNNKKIKYQAEHASSFLNVESKNLKDHIIAIEWETLLRNMESALGEDYYSVFCKKYFPSLITNIL